MAEQLADFTRAAALGFKSGESMSTGNPLGQFIKMMLAQQMQTNQMRTEYGMKKELIDYEGQSKLNLEREKSKLAQENMSKFFGGGQGESVGGWVPTEMSIDTGMGNLKITNPKEQEREIERKIKENVQRDVQTRSAKLGELNKVIDFFESKIQEIPSGKGIGGRVKGIGLGIEGLLQTNPNVAAYMADVEGMRSQIARGLGEVGNLSEQEQRAAMKLLPGVSDNTETRLKKISNFRDYIKKKSGVNAPKSSTVDYKSKYGLD